MPPIPLPGSSGSFCSASGFFFESSALRKTFVWSPLPSPYGYDLCAPKKPVYGRNSERFLSFLCLSLICHSQIPMSDKSGKAGSHAERSSAGTDSIISSLRLYNSSSEGIVLTEGSQISS
ncbi:hypothetical protein EO98_09520 [Methanosarcina sp. 2.H.T.1A.6]|nr:hypothetical protein EO94_15910 [Methanosarcina sp. 2.H.T.1A.3]KKG19689.1 hypothetical protein EO98_09520 [Methanosarcina sp. 2.H.T.1A.6]KKG27076.1 hypothetical protein EO96_08930 [Methanosarcina sp. 2.H.T.1A.8]KKH48988.1 hypothetical protein EO93_02630 [Methanosarcina sp. 1.H.A.2.2]